MFTGLIERVGSIVALELRGDAGAITVAHEPWASPVVYGESIAVNGVCLTVARCGGREFSCDVLDETLSRTNLGSQSSGAPVNLERAMPATGRFGGHIVQGHVDGVGTLEAREQLGRDWRLRVSCSETFTAEMVRKGSITLNGVSLTLTEVTASGFDVNVIPVTVRDTNLGRLPVGAPVNIETDILAKYVRKCCIEARSAGHVSIDDLQRAGFC